MDKISIIAVLLAIVCIPSLFLNLYFFREIKNNNKVVQVVDGDTFQLASGKRVRLLGVMAPEYDRCGGKEAKDRLIGLISDQSVQLKEEVLESYGRTMALVYVGNTLVNNIMMSEGWARPDYRKNSQRNLLTDSYHQAKNSQLGIFGSLCKGISGNLPEDCIIKANIDLATSEKFYHLPGCAHYDEVVIDFDRGEQYFCTEAEASAAGFTKASSCP